MLGLADGSDGADLSYNPAWIDQIHPDDQPTARAIAADLLEGRVDLFDVVVRWNPRNGGEKWVRARGRVAERDSARRALRIRGTVSDISSYIELRDAIRRLEEQKATLSDIIRNFPSGAVGLFDNSLRFIQLDGRGEVGSSRGERSLVNRLVLEDYPVEARDQIAAAFRSALTGNTTDFEIVIEGVRLQARVGPVTDSAGRVTRGVASFHTVRERERRSVAKK
jgi:PAS domain-containing protein